MSDAIFVPVCSDEDRTFPYPYDCSKYYQCASGRPIRLGVTQLAITQSRDRAGRRPGPRTARFLLALQRVHCMVVIV
jgi:hypothetical protein